MLPARHPPPVDAARADAPSRALVVPLAANRLGNRLLAALAPQDWQHWCALLTHVELPRREVLYESGASIAHAYFPTTALVSLEYVTDSGGTAEIALVGPEGVVGVPLFIGPAFLILAPTPALEARKLAARSPAASNAATPEPLHPASPPRRPRRRQHRVEGAPPHSSTLTGTRLASPHISS